MKKFFKYSLYGLIYIVIIFFFAIMFIVTAKAELIKPNDFIQPHQVVKIQLTSLMKNDDPKQNNGIKQTWEFAHPNNQKVTGPLPNFINMINSASYKMLLNHISHELSMVYSSDDRYAFEVKILDKEKKYFQFQWVVEKYLKDGPLKNCWLTTAVSAPMSLGSSI